MGNGNHQAKNCNYKTLAMVSRPNVVKILRDENIFFRKTQRKEKLEKSPTVM